MQIIMDKRLIGKGGSALKRCYFKPKEDLVLLHVKVASSVLLEGVLGVTFPICNRLMSRIRWGNLVVSEITLRDFLRRECPESYDKTSMSCIKRLMKKLRKDEPKHDYLLDQLAADKNFINVFHAEAVMVLQEVRMAGKGLKLTFEKKTFRRLWFSNNIM